MSHVIIGAFSEEDLRRLHALLVAYESPYQTPDERAERLADEQAHDKLREQIARLLAGPCADILAHPEERLS